jgi:hypothetical protein
MTRIPRVVALKAFWFAGSLNIVNFPKPPEGLHQIWPQRAAAGSNVFCLNM